MEATEQELKQNEDQWDSLTFGKTEEDCKGKNLLNWRKDTRALLSKVKSSSLDEIKAMVKIPESMQKVLDAYLTLLKFKTAKARTQAIKEFKDRKLDLLKAAKTFKSADLTYGDCKQIQELLAGLEADKVGLTNVACRDLIKWTSNMVLLRIAEALYPESVKAAATPSKPSVKAKKSTEESNVQPTKNSEESKVETVQSTEETKDNVDTHVEPTPVEPTPAEPTPAEPTPVEPAPVEPAPVEPTPAEPTPTETKSAEQKPKKTKQPKVKPIEPKKTPAKRPTTAVTKKPKTNKVDEEEKKEPTTKDKSEEPSVVTKKPTVPKVKRKKKEEEKEDWSIFGTFDENPDPTQVQAFTQNLRSSLETLTKNKLFDNIFYL